MSRVQALIASGHGDTALAERRLAESVAGWRRIALPGLGYGAEAKVRDGHVWVWERDDAVLRVVTPGRPATGDLRVTLDCRPWIARPQPPADLDLHKFERSQLGLFRAELSSTRTDEHGQVTSLIDGVSIDTTELRGTFPGSQLVALFHWDNRPAVQFGRRRSLYDELGNPIRHQYAHVYLAEDIATGGLPPLRECVPDASGVVCA